VIDTQAIMSLEILAVNEEAKVYGPVIPRLVGASAASFVADRLHEKPPSVEKLDQAVDYIKKSQSIYPKAFTALAYGVIKAVSILEGSSGGGTRLFASLMKAVLDNMGLKKMVGATTGTADAVKKNTKFNEDMNTVPKGSTEITGDENSALETITGCDYIDVCKQLSADGITRAAVGGMECTYALADAVAASILTDANHDYQVLTFEPPKCKYRVFRISQ
jgi:hypothetical protein